jgi:hypothetical protein
VKAKARERLERAADLLALELLGIATRAESESVKLAAIRDALDRAGVSAKQALELSAATTEPKPYEEMLMGISGIATVTRAEHYEARGLPAPELPAPPARALPAEVLDAELVEPASDTAESAPNRPAEVRTEPEPPDGPPEPPLATPSLVTMEEAVTETRIREVRRMTRRYR